MKSFLLTLIVTVFAFLYSCEKKPYEKPEEPKDPYWRTTHQYFNLAVDEVWPYSYSETIKEELEQETSVEVSDAESYRLSFIEDGTGFGSGVRHDGVGRFDFAFTWQLSDAGPPFLPQSPDEKWLTLTEIGDGYGGIFFTYDWTAKEWVDWRIEEFTDNKLVLSYFEWREVDDLDIGAGWIERHTYRYTFEKVN